MNGVTNYRPKNEFVVNANLKHNIIDLENVVLLASIINYFKLQFVNLNLKINLKFKLHSQFSMITLNLQTLFRKINLNSDYNCNF